MSYCVGHDCEGIDSFGADVYCFPHFAVNWEPQSVAFLQKITLSQRKQRDSPTKKQAEKILENLSVVAVFESSQPTPYLGLGGSVGTVELVRYRSLDRFEGLLGFKSMYLRSVKSISPVRVMLFIRKTGNSPNVADFSLVP